MDAQSYAQALANLGWNHVKAAAMFGVSERTAWRYSQVGAPGPVARLITIYTLRPDTQQLADAKLASSAPQQSRRGPLGHPLLALMPSDSWSRVFKKKEEQRPLADIAWKRFLDAKRDAPRARTFAEIWDEVLPLPSIRPACASARMLGQDATAVSRRSREQPGRRKHGRDRGRISGAARTRARDDVINTIMPLDYVSSLDYVGCVEAIGA